jgi:YesN/AraC family two-component response regulator
MYTILLVDDERWVRTALRKTIEKAELPFKVIHELSNGIEAYDWIKANEVDLVITDIRMPVMDGLALIEKLDEENLEMPQIIIVSGHDDFQYAQRALRMGAFDYLLKPVEVEDMRKCLTQWEQARQTALPEDKDFEISELSPIEQILRHIEAAMPGDITLKEAASKVHLNASYLSQLFKQQMNKNFVDYVTERRMQEAVKLLKSTSLRIYEIAERLGYNDLAYFSNSFKKLIGHTPSEYRKLHK